MTIRLASAADAGAVFTLVRALAEYEELLPEFHATAADFEHLLETGACQALLAQVEDETVGVALFYPTALTFLGGRGLWLEDLFVLPAHRGAGHGMALLRALARLGVEGGFVALEWNVLDGNAPAIALYDRIGATARTQWTDRRLSGAALSALAA